MVSRAVNIAWCVLTAFVGGSVSSSKFKVGSDERYLVCKSADPDQYSHCCRTDMHKLTRKFVAVII